MLSNNDAHFTHRISQIEADLLNPILDRSTLTAFNDRWQTLVDDIQSALEANTLTYSTISMIHELAHRVPIIIQTFIDLETISQTLMSSLDLEASSILGIPTLDKSATSASIFAGSSPSSPSTSFPSYIEPSYKWLLKNIHDPYPTTNIRDTIANETGSARKDVDSWFIDARKRIGWNALRRSRFSKRADIVDAAARFFIEDDPKRPLDPNIELEFAAIETRAKDLYSQKLSESHLAAQLNSVIKDMTPEMKVQAKAEDIRRRLQALDEKTLVKSSRAISSYPSPTQSPGRYSDSSLPPIPSPEIVHAEVLDNAACHSSKRRNLYDCSNDEDYIRSSKRPRLDISSPNTIDLATHLPSPAPSSSEPLEILRACDQATPLIPSYDLSAVSTTRKRRLSSGDSYSTPKRPSNLPISSRSQAVSDPMPFGSKPLDASDFDRWFHYEDTLSALEIELYDVSKFTEQVHIGDSVQKSLMDQNIVAPIMELPEELTLDISTNDFNYDELFWPDDFTQEFEGHDFAQFNDASSLLCDPLLGINFESKLRHGHEKPLHTVQNIEWTLVEDASPPISNSPTSTFDWTFPSFIPLPSLATTCPGGELQNILNFPPQDINTFVPPATMNHSPIEISQLGNGNCQDQSRVLAQAERAAKQKKLLEIKETARRLEEELALS